MVVDFAEGIHVVMATDGKWRRYWAVSSAAERAVSIVSPLTPTGYTVSLTSVRLTIKEAAALKLRGGQAKELMYDPSVKLHR